MKNIIDLLKRILTIPNTFDPDDLRRRQVLNTVLVLIIVTSSSLLITSFTKKNIISDLQTNADTRIAFAACVSALLLSIVLLLLNRSSRMPKNLVGWIFVVGLTAIISVSDSPLYLTNGRSIFAWAIPTTLSVIVLPPASIFAVDVVITVLFWFLGGPRRVPFQTSFTLIEIYVLLEVYVVSFISWLGMSIAERAIRDARNESRKNTAILKGVAEGVIVLGSNGQLVLANRVASDLIGDDLPKITPAMDSAEIGGRTLSFHWSEVEGVGRVAIVHDISRQIEIERAKDAILRVVSHEMRTPLSAILGFAEILEVRAVPGLASRIRANGQRMLKLVNDLLDMAQIQAGALTMHTENFAPGLLRAYVLEHFSKAAEQKGVGLEVQVSPAFPAQVCGDVQRLEQVLSNLVENGLKFTEPGGRVEVCLCAEGETTWQIVVKDSGVGIPPEQLPDIFEPFRRASDFAKRKQQGVGLGLSIARKIAQLSGGDLSVASTVGKGSTFILTLPVHSSLTVQSEGV